MDYQLHDGAILTERLFCEKVQYDVSNSILIGGFDGCGSIIHYSLAGGQPQILKNSFYSGFTVDNIRVSSSASKKILMRGRRQRLEVNENFILDQFIDQETNCLVYRFELPPPIKDFSWDFGFVLHDADHPLHIITKGENLILREKMDKGYHYTLHRTSDEKRIFYIGFSSEGITELNLPYIYQQSLEYEAELLSYITTENELYKALLVSSLNAGISSYKSVGDFKGFFAGIHYQSPARTYYRDGYYTVLPLIKIRQNWVREQIRTLASGIDSDSDCPSGVQEDGGSWWPKHADSPLYFILLIGDYLQITQDESILYELVKGVTIQCWMIKVIKRMISQIDEIGLLPREEWNRKDWVDNIYRCGYVSYIQILLYRALIFMENLQPEEQYGRIALKLKDSFNRILWSENKGHYVNYQNENYREDNLSLDTVLALKYCMVPDDRKERFINNIENILETRSNKNQPYGDWGVMCVYPPYKISSHLVEKSMYEYVYHNGSDWPYLSACWAWVKKEEGRDYNYPLTRWFTYGLEQGWYTPVEYFNPLTGKGSLLQGWSAMAASVFIYGGDDSQYKIKV